ncbi:RTA1 like protein-domain-containing protein [Fusarium flagelliforme]|uniref:RTA1 like protein-domain-containing protein n=1 Tax=Fusarium flagelliforme TaxID=2675880 RepID=UPI001E8D1BA8|nr:RTA1 like protein-domain-containing protein [Fusarium flagelliforme]KAH7198468.1 RTA1 like protein-domain-containing protein [Fusarium flagelliforme]
MAGSDAPQAYVFYNYNPSMVAAVIFIVVFGVSSLLHTYQLVRARTWYFIPFLIGCLFECVGYVGRALSANEAPDFSKNPYIIQSILLLLGPALLAASIYMVLGRLIKLLDADNLSIIGPRWLTKVFVTGDVLSFLAQSAGGGMLATAKDRDAVKRGENIIVGGLGIQIIFFGFFMIVTLIFHLRINRIPTQKSLEIATPWKKLLLVLYAASLSILVRSVFRVAEYIMGKDSALQSQEFWIYVFDALLMSLVVVSLNWFHPSRVINGALDRKRIVSQDGYALESQPHGRDQRRYSLSPVRPKYNN